MSQSSLHLYELRHEDKDHRLRAVENLKNVASDLGEVRTRDELLPYISECLDDEEEVLTVFAEIIPQFLDVIGGPEYIYLLLPSMESLAASEETIVRDKAVEGLKNLGSQLDDEQFQTHFAETVKRLASGSFFPPKVSACALFPFTYIHLNEEAKQEFRKTYIDFCNDRTPMVRKAAFTHLKDFIELIEDDVVLNDFLPILKNGAKDRQDHVRFLVIDNCIAFAKKLDEYHKENDLRPIFLACVNDPSWRVRYVTASEFANVIQALGGKITEEYLDAFVNLLQDKEHEVRSIVCTSIVGMCKLLNVDQIKAILLPRIEDLIGDESDQVRLAIAKNITELSPILAETSSDWLVNQIITLLTDTNSDVKLSLMKTLTALGDFIKIDRLKSIILDSINFLSENDQWRVRLSTIELIPSVASVLGEEYFSSNLSELCLSWLCDKVCTIRQAAIKNLQKLIELFGVNWAQKNIIEKVLNYHTHSNYLYRITTLNSISEFASVFPKEDLREMLEIVIKLSEDPVPNIRLNTCKTLEDIMKYLDKETIEESVKPVLENLLKDEDRDVQYHAYIAFSKI